MRAIAVMALGAGLVVLHEPATWAACLCDIPSNRVTCDGNNWGDDPSQLGDEYYVTSACPERFQGDAANFRFNETWNNFGRSEGLIIGGFRTGCSPYLPYGRTLNALAALAELSLEPVARPTSRRYYYNDFYTYTAQLIHETRAYCWQERDPKRNNIFAEAFSDDKHVDIYMPFFTMNVVERAAGVAHEAHHLGYNTPGHVDCHGVSEACDSQFDDSHELGGLSHLWPFQGPGSYSIQVWVLEQFAQNDSLAPRFLRDNAIDSANSLLATKFTTPTDYWIPPLPTLNCPPGFFNPKAGRSNVCLQCPSGLADHGLNQCLPPCPAGMVPNEFLNGCHGHSGSGSSCHGGNECDGNLYCAQGRCIPPGGLFPGSSCNASVQCLSGVCNNGVCQRPNIFQSIQCDTVCKGRRNSQTLACEHGQVTVCHPPD